MSDVIIFKIGESIDLAGVVELEGVTDFTGYTIESDLKSKEGSVTPLTVNWVGTDGSYVATHDDTSGFDASDYTTDVKVTTPDNKVIISPTIRIAFRESVTA